MKGCFNVHSKASLSYWVSHGINDRKNKVEVEQALTSHQTHYYLLNTHKAA